MHVTPGSKLPMVTTTPPSEGRGRGRRLKTAVEQFALVWKFGIALTFRFGSKLSAKLILVKGTLFMPGF